MISKNDNICNYEKLKNQKRGYIKKDNDFKTKIEEFLMTGKSDTPENIFKKLGINISKIDFFKDGLKTIEEDIARLEKLVK